MEQRLLQPEENQPSKERMNSSAAPHALSEETAGRVEGSTEGSIEGSMESSSVGVGQAEDMKSVLSLESRQFRRRMWRNIILFELCSLMAAWLLKRYAESFLAAPAFIIGFIGALCLLTLLTMPAERKRRLQRRRLAANVAEQYDVRAIGALIDAQKLDDLKTREIALDALILLLPRLQASDAALLNDSQRAKLCNILSLPVENPLFKDVRDLFRPARNRTIEVRVAILQAFEQVGDSRALAVVERLAKREAGSAGEKRIQEAARQCLPALQLRTEEQRSSQTLLRAADASSAVPDTLLRAAEETPSVQPEQLLRPSS